MKQLGWPLIFFLILTYIIITTVDVSGLYQSPYVQVVEENGFAADATITSASADIEGELYKSFAVTLNTEEDVVLLVEIQKNWLERMSSFAIYALQDDWVKVPFEKKSDLKDSEVFIIEDVQETTYAIVGDQTEGKNPSALFGILLTSIIIILFAMYHHTGEKEVTKHEESYSMRKLEDYLRKELVAGYEEKDIKKALISAGWDPNAVNQGLRRVRFF